MAPIAAGILAEGTAPGAQAAPPPTVPGAPTLVSAVPGNATVTLTWTAPTTGGAPASYTIIQTGAANQTITGVTGLTYTVTGLTNTDSYTFGVEGANTAGTGIESNTLSATPTLTVPGAPTLVSAVAGNAQVVLTWTAPTTGGAPANYTVVQTGTASQNITGVSGLTHTVIGLTNGDSYTFGVIAVNATGGGPESNTLSATPTAPLTVPGPPTLVSAVAGNLSVVLTWTAPTTGGPPAGYTVIQTGAASQNITGITSSPYTVTGLTNGSSYTFGVEAVNAAGTGAESNTLSATPTPTLTVPGAPTLVSAVAGNGQVVITWSAPSTGGLPASYTIVQTGAASQNITGISASPYTVSALTNGSSYTFGVKAVNAAGTGAESTTLSATPTPTVPGAPTLASLTPGNAAVTLTWSAPSSNGGSAITGYNIMRGTTPGGETLLVGGKTPPTYTDATAVNGTTYYYTVVAVNTVGPGAPSSELSATPTSSSTAGYFGGIVGTAIAVPGAPTLVSAVAGNAAITVTWTAPSTGGAPTGYNVLRTYSGGSGSSVATSPFTISGLTNGVVYTVGVDAFNSAGTGPESNTIAATPATVPGAPTLSSAVASNGQVVLTWTAPSSNGGSALTSYQVWRGTSSGGETSLVTGLGTGSFTYTDSTAVNGTTYFYTVAAANGVGTSSQSNELNATPSASTAGFGQAVMAPPNGPGLKGTYTAGMMLWQDTFQTGSLNPAYWRNTMGSVTSWGNDPGYATGTATVQSTASGGGLILDNSVAGASSCVVTCKPSGFPGGSGLLVTFPSAGFYIQQRIEISTTNNGFFPATWFPPEGAGAEIDIFEGGWLGGTPDFNCHSDYGATGTGVTEQQAVSSIGVDLATSFVIYGFEWRPGVSAKFYMNNQLVFTANTLPLPSTTTYNLAITPQFTPGGSSGWHTQGAGTGQMRIAEVQMYSLP